MPSAADVAPAELESYLQRLFQIGDRNGDGVLSPAEFESLLRKSGFKFDDATIRRIMNAVDTNHDGVIQYEEFVPAILALVRHKSSAPAAAPAPTAAPAAGMPNLSDVPPAQLERYMQRLFKIGDKDNDGSLDALELRDLLSKSGFALDNQTIAHIMVAVDTNRDGVIQYNEFVPAVQALIEEINKPKPMPEVSNMPAPESS
eukprot:TRINITY_DN786_c0_g1_i11.p1 TRINITY_DN786_c0_g1~~TRINITY_DN786_c0_g1_i11.p1  ORF type:complete len:202 (+),score=74.82 TRINITY_DN786_c0_g1_i11:1-606(+)